MHRCQGLSYHIDGDVRPESNVEGGIKLGEDVEEFGEAGQVGQDVARARKVSEVAAEIVSVGRLSEQDQHEEQQRGARRWPW